MKRLILFLLPVLLLTGCDILDLIYNEASYIPPREVGLGQARAELPELDSLYCYFAAQNYTVWDFNDWLQADVNNLPERLILLRYDIHYEDMREAYSAYTLQCAHLGPCTGTWFVMLDNPYETVEDDYAPMRRSYLSFIEFAGARGEDVQPHISPCDMYLHDRHPVWERMSRSDLQVIFDENYQIRRYPDGVDFDVIGEDVLDLADINARLPELLVEYNGSWTRQTGLDVVGYAAHGSPVAMQRVMWGERLLDQRCLLQLGIYAYDSYNTAIFSHLEYLHDTYFAAWMKDPTLIEPGQYELLIHPNQWHLLHTP
ncbi:MAG: hypothetical protein K8R90_04490 [Candidatus Cloacimonetes bacterium]|nr:hypothetical protein [Candidatus Cloacimonadota bacterium]